MKTEREFGMVPNRSNPDRYIRLVQYEQHIDSDGPDVSDPGVGKRVTAVRREFELMDVSNPRGANYAGTVWSWECVHVEELRGFPPSPHVRDPDHDEPEELRRQRILAIRLAIHTGDKRYDIPKWAPRVAAA
jgi:hypothetical protein